MWHHAKKFVLYHLLEVRFLILCIYASLKKQWTFFSEVGLPAHILGSRRPRGTTFEFNYLRHFEAKVEYNSGDESEAQRMFTDEKNSGEKSHARVLLKV
jgi:hypothetical protein